MADAREPQPQPDDSDEAFRQEFEKKPSSLPDVGIDLSGFATEQEAQAVGQAVWCNLHSLGKVLNLKRLCRVVVAYDYNGELARLDRGAETSEILTPTQDDIAVGIAMTPAIIENGEPRSVMVLNASHMIVLAHPENPEVEEHRQRMIHTLAHECAHVHNLEAQARAFPDALLRMKLSYKDGVLYRIAAGCWDEYIASRLSAFMGQEFTTRDLEDTFCAALERAKPLADASIRQYRMHGEVPRVTREVAEDYRCVLVYASYLLGHLDGLGCAIEESAPKAFNLVEHTSYFKPFLVGLHAELRTMYGSYGHWETVEVLEPLKRLANELLRVGGLEIQMRDNGPYIVLPFTPETMPSFQELLEFNRSKSPDETHN